MKFIAKTLYGLENILAKELREIGAQKITVSNRAVIFEGDLRLMYTANYVSRTSLSILYELSEFTIRTADDLYRKGRTIEWEKYLDLDDTFSIVPVIKSPVFNHTGYAALILKDSIADYFREKKGRRPSVDNKNPAILINLHISNNKVTVSLDSSGIPLFKREYRKEAIEAPLNEVLAAGMLLLSGWDGTTCLTDPMCGSGTIPVEAGLIACNIPSGRLRKFFGFQHWRNYDLKLYDSVRKDYDSRIRKPEHPIYGFDVSGQAVKTARANVRRAGLAEYINIEECDFKNLKPLSDNGFIFINPPYGERLSQGETNMLYSMIGSTLKHHFHDHTAWIISSNKQSLKNIGLKPTEKHILFNGALECLYVRYDLYEGSRKSRGITNH
jgi:putative N6-adenine-specific DNA methylase